MQSLFRRFACAEQERPLESDKDSQTMGEKKILVITHLFPPSAE